MQPFTGITSTLIILLALFGVVDLAFDLTDINAAWFIGPFAFVFTIAVLARVGKESVKVAIVEAYLTIEKYQEAKQAAHEAAHVTEDDEYHEDMDSVFESEGIRRG